MKLPPAPTPIGLSHQRQGEQVCQGSLLQQALLPLTNARVERLPCNSSLPLGLTTNNGCCQHCSSSNAHGCTASQHGDPRSWSMRDSSLVPHRSQPAASHHRDFPPPLQWGGGMASQALPTPNPHPQETGSCCPLWPCCHQGRAGWVNPLPSSGPRTGWDNLSPRTMPEADHFAGSFIQAEFAGKAEAGSQLMTRFQTGSAGTVPGLLNAPLLRRVTGHLPAATPTAGLQPPPLASAWHSWKREQAVHWRASRKTGSISAAPVL